MYLGLRPVKACGQRYKTWETSGKDVTEVPGGWCSLEVYSIYSPVMRYYSSGISATVLVGTSSPSSETLLEVLAQSNRNVP